MSMTAAVAAESKSIYDRIAAIVCRPGMPRKQMDALVSKALKNYPLWRVRACRLGEAGSASAAATFDLQQRYRAFMEAEGKRLAHERTIEVIKRAPAPSDMVQLGRAEFDALLTRISALELALQR